jgi:hypothetical protein
MSDDPPFITIVGEPTALYILLVISRLLGPYCDVLFITLVLSVPGTPNSLSLKLAPLGHDRMGGG